MGKASKEPLKMVSKVGESINMRMGTFMKVNGRMTSNVEGEK